MNTTLCLTGNEGDGRFDDVNDTPYVLQSYTPHLSRGRWKFPIFQGHLTAVQRQLGCIVLYILRSV